MEKKNKIGTGRAVDVLVLVPGFYGAAVMGYFTFLAKTVPLSAVFPWFFYLFFAAALISVVLTIHCLYHLFRMNLSAGPFERALWILGFGLVNGITLPVYRFTQMRTVS